MGNFGLFCGNWGQRGTLGGDARKRQRKKIHDRQILRSPAQVVVLCEATAEVEELLKQPPVEGIPGQKGLEG